MSSSCSRPRRREGAKHVAITQRYLEEPPSAEVQRAPHTRTMSLSHPTVKYSAQLLTVWGLGHIPKVLPGPDTLTDSASVMNHSQELTGGRPSLRLGFNQSCKRLFPCEFAEETAG